MMLKNLGISYVIADRHGIVTLADGDPFYIALDLAPGHPVWAVIPELLGSEAELQAILDGELPSLQLPLINRNGGEGDTDGLLNDDAASFRFAFLSFDQDSEDNGGLTRFITITVLPDRGSSTEITGLIVLIEDATEEGVVQQRIMQQRNELVLLRDQLARQNVQLQAANRELRQLDELKSRFVAVAAHELRTPLTAISGYTELLSEGSFGPLDERQRRPLDIISQSADRLLEIISKLLDISHIETGCIQLNMRPTPPGEIVQSCLDEYRMVAGKRNQTITLDCPLDAPQVLCDPARTIQILGNLLGNACKYTPEGGDIHVYAGLADQEGCFQIAVRDTGIGIPPEEQEHLFSAFFRARNADQIDANGAGLGLHIARALVELQGGEIRCESEPGHGSTFSFILPLAM
jgi:signal transduction histidine kinase